MQFSTELYIYLGQVKIQFIGELYIYFGQSNYSIFQWIVYLLRPE